MALLTAVFLALGPAPAWSAPRPRPACGDGSPANCCCVLPELEQPAARGGCCALGEESAPAPLPVSVQRKGCGCERPAPAPEPAQPLPTAEGSGRRFAERLAFGQRVSDGTPHSLAPHADSTARSPVPGTGRASPRAHAAPLARLLVTRGVGAWLALLSFSRS